MDGLERGLSEQLDFFTVLDNLAAPSQHSPAHEGAGQHAPGHESTISAHPRSNEIQHHLDAIEQSLLKKIEELLDQSFAKQSENLRSILQERRQSTIIQDQRQLRTTHAVDSQQFETVQAAAGQGSSDCTLPKANDSETCSDTQSRNGTEASAGALESHSKQEQEEHHDASKFHKALSLLIQHEELELRPHMHARKGDILQELVQSIFFHCIVVVMIVLQSIFLGWEANQRLVVEKGRLERTSMETELPNYFISIGIVFNVFFSLEILLRLAAWRLKFFNTSDQEFFSWNLFDAAVLLGLLLELVDLDVDLLRVVRLLRAARVLRIIRGFSKLRKMIYALMHSMQAMTPLIVMLFLTLYMFSLAFMQGAYQHLADMTVEDFDRENVTGGDEWDWLLLPIMHGSWVYSILAIFFVLFFVFAVMNVVTGVFVDEAMKISQIDKDILISDAIGEQNATLRDIRQFVASLDTDHDGTVTANELISMLNNSQIQRWLKGLDIELNIDNVNQILKVLGSDKTGRIDPESFIDILGKLKGEARSVDLVMMSYQIKMEHKQLRQLLKLEEEIDRKETLILEGERFSALAVPPVGPCC